MVSAFIQVFNNLPLIHTQIHTDATMQWHHGGWHVYTV